MPEEIPYPFKLPPYKHQMDCWQQSRNRKYFALFADMGTGKSKMLIDTVSWLYDQGQINGVLILAPKGVYRNWLDLELPIHMPTHIPYVAAPWASVPNKADRLKQKELDEIDGNDLAIFVVNTEALSSKRGALACRDFLLSHRTLLAIDESTHIKNHASKRTKVAFKLARIAEYRRILSGDPAANSPLNLWAQFHFLDPDALGVGSYFAFRNQFAVLQDMQIGRYNKNGSQGTRVIKQVVGYRNQEQLKKLIQPHAFIVKKEDCLDLPPKIYQKRSVELSKTQRQAYQQMQSAAMVLLNSLGQPEEPDDPLAGSQLSFEELQDAYRKTAGNDRPTLSMVTGPQMTINIVITQLLRLHQICCGFMTEDETGNIVEFDGGNPRLDALMETLEDSGSNKAIIWATYRYNIKQLQEALEKQYGPKAVVAYHGGVKTADRQEAIKRFQGDPECKFFLGNPQTAGFGLTLVAANLVIYYSNSYDREHRGQSEDRCHRIGQKQSVTYVDIVATKTVDEKIIRVLRAKKQLAQVITASNWKRLFQD